MPQGNIFVISAASGAGKSSLVKQICKLDPKIKVSISHTTRDKRHNEINNHDYYFVSIDEFKKMLQNNEFIEYAKVYDNYYGTNKNSLEHLINNSYDVILEIDWQGAIQIKNAIPKAILIYIMPPSIEELKKRLILRGTDSNEVIEKRILKAEEDISYANKFKHIIYNEDFNKSLDELYSIILLYRQ